MSVVTRFAPSPTGFLHIGGARTALFSYLYAKKHGGKFLLRIEDTDRERSTQEAVDAIFEGMAWLGLKSDFEHVYQTKRFERYAEVIGQMLKAGTAYHCYCSKQELDVMRAAQSRQQAEAALRRTLAALRSRRARQDAAADPRRRKAGGAFS